MEEFFPVAEKKVIVEGGKIIPDKKAIVRTDTNEVLGIVSNQYRLVRHEEVLNSVNRVFDDLSLKESKKYFCARGAIMFSRFFGNGKYSKEVKVGDIVRFGIEVFNSYNGRLPVGLILIGERLKCSNGMIVPETITSFVIKHYNSLSLDDVRNKASEILNKLNTIVSYYRKWSEIKVDKNRVQTFFNSTFGSKYKVKLFEKYQVEKEGDTIWDLYNFFTRWITHEFKVRKNNIENYRLAQFNKEMFITDRIIHFANSIKN